MSGFEVVKSWLAYRMKKGAGKNSCPWMLSVRKSWEFDEELLDLLRVLEHTVAMWPDLRRYWRLLWRGKLFAAKDFPEPTPVERAAKKAAPLFDMAD